jgi:lambda family phage portal protein
MIVQLLNALSFGKINREFERAYFEGAKSTRLNRDFNVSNNHFEVQAGSDREMLKARARWLSANNPITKSIDKSLQKNVIGTGIKLQSNIKDSDVPNAKALNDEIESLFEQWSSKNNFDITKRMDFTTFQLLALKHKITDGEILVNKIFTKDKDFPLKIQLIESDMFDNAKTKNGSNNVLSGVEIDSFGAVIAYHLKKSYDGFASQRYDAESILHYYEMERATQYRGITDYAQTINNLKDFSAYQDSEIVKNRILSSFAIFMKTPNLKSSVFGDQQKGKAQGLTDPIKEITAGMIKYLKNGEEPHVVQSNQMNTAYNEFITTTIRLIAAGRDISYELAFRDYSKVNFSSARASLIQDHKKFDMEQIGLVSNVISPTYESFLDSMVLSGRLKVGAKYWSEKQKYLKPSWTMPKREWVDPVKDINAIKEELALGITTRTDIAKSRGKNWDDVIEKQYQEEQKIKELKKKYGIVDAQ